MSWDVFAMHIPASVKRVSDIPEDFKPQPIGTRPEIIAKILEVSSAANFTDPSWGTIDGPDWSIEVSIGDKEPITSFAFHIRGGDQAAFAVAEILGHLGLRAIDTGSEIGLFELSGDSLDGFARWRAYRDQVCKQ